VEEDLLTTRRVCERLGFSKSWVQNKLREDWKPESRVPLELRFPKPLSLPFTTKNLWTPSSLSRWLDAWLTAQAKSPRTSKGEAA
jgi:predicted DNA-binding transcriptional regulator AlpA